MPLIRARDLRANIKDHGFDQGVVMTLERALDEMSELRANVRDLVSMVDNCIDQMDKLVRIGDAMRSTIDEMKRIQQQGEAHGNH